MRARKKAFFLKLTFLTFCFCLGGMPFAGEKPFSWHSSGLEARTFSESFEKGPLSPEEDTWFSLFPPGEEEEPCGKGCKKGIFLWERYPWLSPDMREKVCVKKDPPFSEGLVVILLDDVGNSLGVAEDFASLSLPLTWAILPGERHTVACRDIAEDRGIPYIVHMPMQALRDEPGSYWYRKSWIVEGMTPGEVKAQVIRAFRELPGALGMNNHRGSRVTEDPELLAPLMDFLAEKELFFLDSRTTSRSLAASAALEKGLPKLENHVFLDHREDPEFFRAQVERLLEIAKKRGWAEGICHARPGTYAFLEEIQEELRKRAPLGTLPGLVDFLRGEAEKELRYPREDE